jgi:hypothetical protein
MNAHHEQAHGHQDGSDRHEHHHHRHRRRWLHVSLGAVAAYLLVAYLALPLLIRMYYDEYQLADSSPRITQTKDGHPGDPINVSLVGTSSDLQGAMEGAGWYPAAALGLSTDLQIAADTALARPDDRAPVSNLYLFGRKEDLAFEQPVGDSPRHRHHVRFWDTGSPYTDGRPTWLGSASYDRSVGFSHTTGQVTHHIAADVDAERDHLFETLRQAGVLVNEQVIDGYHTQLSGRNGGGDPWHTDGRLVLGVIRPGKGEVGEQNDEAAGR